MRLKSKGHEYRRELYHLGRTARPIIGQPSWLHHDAPEWFAHTPRICLRGVCCCVIGYLTFALLWTILGLYVGYQLQMIVSAVVTSYTVGRAADAEW